LPTKINDGDLYYPLLEPMKEMFLTFTLLLIQVLQKCPKKQDATYNFEIIYDDVNKKDTICEIINEPLVAFDFCVNNNESDKQ
jgi:hypothetical protein